MSLAGNLKTVSFPDILQLLASGKKTGILEVKTSTRQKEVAFKVGNIIYASSVNASEDLLGNMLLRRGKITKMELQRAIDLHKQTGRQLGTTLIDMNLFSKEDIAECLRLQIEEIVYNLFAWEEGDFFFHEGAVPQNTPFLIEMSTMNVVMEGTRRIDEWMEIQKIIPPDDVIVALSAFPNVARDELTISLEEFRVMSLINGENTMKDIIDSSPLSEFVTCRSIYKLMTNSLVEATGKKEAEPEEQEDEEEVLLAIAFKLYNNCFFRIRSIIDAVLGEENTKFFDFASKYRKGIYTFFTGFDPDTEEGPSYESYLKTIRSIPEEIRIHKLMVGLQDMLSEQLEFVYQLLGDGVYKGVVSKIKKEIAEPLAVRRDLVKRYSLDENFYKSIKNADKMIKAIRG
jgi:hypothetical protein